jgi:flavin reductase (DIM6/NTAB) family NADH-FMN oxidoreductase RutF
LTNYFSINAITEPLIEKSHQTSANFAPQINEFEITDIEMEIKKDCLIPFVQKSPIQLLCKYVNEYIIQENNTIHVIASIEKIYVEEELLATDHWIQLDKGNIVAINGLDGYARTELVNRFSYARVNKSLEIIG